MLPSDGFLFNMGSFPTHISGTREKLGACYFRWGSQLLNKDSSGTLPGIFTIRADTLRLRLVTEVRICGGGKAAWLFQDILYKS